ncbi:MAG TPA: isochorismate synthase, partial [Solirubrobacteraceae bacterium]|nr:isochorismate synthase [Solirubrobacteraceae bacterium]
MRLKTAGSTGTQAEAGSWLDAPAWTRLGRRLQDALARARRGRHGAEVIASVSCQLTGALAGADPSAIVVASRVGAEPWFVLEQPARAAQSLATLGCARELTAEGPDRFTQVARAWRELVAGAAADPVPHPPAPPGVGLAAVGGFAFADEVADPRWRGFAAASLLVPEFALARRGSHAWLTVNVSVTADDT